MDTPDMSDPIGEWAYNSRQQLDGETLALIKESTEQQNRIKLGEARESSQTDNGAPLYIYTWPVVQSAAA